MGPFGRRAGFVYPRGKFQAGSWIERASCEIVEAALAAGHLERSRPTREEIARNNREAREAAARVAASSTMTAPGAVPSSVRGHAATATVVRYQGAPFLVPAGARAQIGDIVQLGPCLTGESSGFEFRVSSAFRLRFVCLTERGKTNRRFSSFPGKTIEKKRENCGPEMASAPNKDIKNK